MTNLLDHFGANPTDATRLHPDLRAYLEPTAFGPTLRHPLVYQIPLMSWKLANALYDAKREGLALAIAARDWARAFVLYERPYRLAVLHEEYFEGEHDMTRDELRSVLPGVWRDTEFPWQFGDQPLDLFRAAGFITDGEPRPLGNVAIWRGQRDAHPVGISWTTDPIRAEWFACRMLEPGDVPVLLSTSVAPSAVLALLSGRGEAEVVVDPAQLGFISRQRLSL